MPAVQTTVSLYTKNAFRGQQSYVSEAHTAVFGNLVDVEADFGVALKDDPALERGVSKGIDANGNVWGIAMREVNHEAKFRPSTGETFYKEKQSVSVFRQGTINIEVTADPIARGQLVFVDANGEFSGATGTATINVTALEAGIVGDVIKARIDIVHA